AQHQFAVAGELHRPALAGEQWAPQHLFQALDLHAYGGLRAPHALRRCGEAARLGNGDQGAQQVEFEQVVYHPDPSAVLINYIRTIRWYNQCRLASFHVTDLMTRRRVMPWTSDRSGAEAVKALRQSGLADALRRAAEVIYTLYRTS